MRTILVIPAYNEADNLERVVGELIRDYPTYDYVIVNDGSTDATADVCRANKFRFLDLPINLGLARLESFRLLRLISTRLDYWIDYHP